MNSDVKMCVQCGNYVDKRSKFCADCGSSLKTHFSCKKCGEHVPRDAKFCNSCGVNVDNAPAVQPQLTNAGWRGVFYRFTWLLSLACLLFPTGGILYQYYEGKWTDDYFAIIGVSALPLVTFITARWILRGAKKKVTR
ncbi:zinc ribbon domain-containing protein [Candidatus Uabimicrobium sp. HlEnr_7]|uniref:zinc ribbon domain-containing protein n=1 Tax=Candidatus Uabimicrobium helgolandensis TaxID=3095367 RepID=UPI003557C5E4